MQRKELDEILNSYKWIKVKRFDPKKIHNDVNNMSDLYHKLNEHHVEETTFLIDKCRELANELLELKANRHSNRVNDGGKDRLLTEYDPQFIYDTYEITKVIEPNAKYGRTPVVGSQHRCILDDDGRISSAEYHYVGFWSHVEGKVVKGKESHKDYILNLDPNTIISEDVSYWRKYYDEYSK